MADEFDFEYVHKKRFFIWIVTALAVAAVAFVGQILFVAIALVGIWFSESRSIKDPLRGFATWMWVLPAALTASIIGSFVYLTSLPLAVVQGTSPEVNPYVNPLALLIFLGLPTLAFFIGFSGSRFMIRRARRKQGLEA